MMSEISPLKYIRHFPDLIKCLHSILTASLSVLTEPTIDLICNSVLFRCFEPTSFVRQKAVIAYFARVTVSHVQYETTENSRIIIRSKYTK